MVKELLLIIILVQLTGCGSDWWNTTFGIENRGDTISGDITIRSGETYIIKGGKTVTNGATMKIEPGAKIRFVALEIGGPGGTITKIGGIGFQDNSKMIAKGTKENPIVFELGSEKGGGVVNFKEDSSNDTVIEYCEFRKVSLGLSNSVIVRYCKFNYASLNISKQSRSFIIYNDFNGEIISIDTSSPSIKYNNLISHLNLDRGAIIRYDSSTPIVEYNNITKSSDKAIYLSGGTLTINNNYIADCNGQTGVDLTGSQSSSGVVYQNPRTTPVPDAGCGW